MPAIVYHPHTGEKYNWKSKEKKAGLTELKNWKRKKTSMITHWEWDKTNKISTRIE